MKVRPYWILLLLSGALALYLIAPLFGPGIPVNIDAPCHYLRAWCILNEDWRIPNNWCGYSQAGIPSSQYYYPIVDALTALLGLVIGLEVSYKLMMTVALLSMGSAVYLLLKSRGYPLAGAIAFGLLVVSKGSWSLGGFEETVIVGMWHYVLSSAFWLVTMVAYINFLRLPGPRTLSLTAIASMFITHPITNFVSVATFGLVTLLNYKLVFKHMRWVAYLAATVLMVNAYYLLPILFKLPSFMGGEHSIGGGSMNMDLYTNFIGNPMPHHIFLLAVLGLALLAANTVREKRPRQREDLWLLLSIVLATAIYFLSNFFNPPLIFYLGQGVRIGTFYAMIVFALVGYLLEWLSRIKLNVGFRLDLRPVVYLIAIALILTSFNATLPLRKNVFLSEMEFFRPALDAYSEMKEGRMWGENPLYGAGNHPLTLTHFHCVAPVYSKIDQLGAGVIVHRASDGLQNGEQGRLYYKQITEYTKEELDGFFEKYNIRYVLAHSQAYIGTLAGFYPGKQFQYLALFETGVDPSFFRVYNGTIESQEYHRTSAWAQVEADGTALLVLENNFYANWQTYVDGEWVPTENCDWQVCVHTGPGRVEFRYESLWYENMGYLLTSAALALLYLKLRKRKSTTRKSS